MPSGPAFDQNKPIKIGDVVDLPKTAMVLQVTAAKTAELDAQRDLLLVDLILGNKTKAVLPISSLLLMGAVTSDWHSYSLSIQDLTVAAAKISSMNIRTFDAELQPGEARK